MGLFKDIERKLLVKIGKKSLEHLGNVAQDVSDYMNEPEKIDFSNQPKIFEEIVNYVEKNKNVDDGNFMSTIIYQANDSDSEDNIKFNICLGKGKKKLLEIRIEYNLTSLEEEIVDVVTVIYDYENRQAAARVMGYGDIESDNIEGINKSLSSIYQEFLNYEKLYKKGGFDLLINTITQD